MIRALTTLKMAYWIFCARTFGEYKHSVGSPVVDYSVYHWRGREFHIPPIDYFHDCFKPLKLD